MILVWRDDDSNVGPPILAASRLSGRLRCAFVAAPQNESMKATVGILVHGDNHFDVGPPILAASRLSSRLRCAFVAAPQMKV
jgi:hypothetical protein